MAKLVDVDTCGTVSVHLKYSDKLEGKVDLAKTIQRNGYDQLYDKSEFDKVFIDEYTNELCWPSGVRMCANALYKQLSLLELMHRLKIDLNNE